jgi:nitroreductase
MFLYNLKIKVQNEYLLPIVRKHRKLADLYYFLFSSDFSREHQKVLNGKYKHLNAMKSSAPNVFHLRRQIHRIEKGLVTKNRRSVFALDYIEETVKNYQKATDGFLKYRDIDESLLKWAGSVLQNYFNVVEKNEVTDRAKARFDQVQHKVRIEANPTDFVPYKRAVAAKSNVDFDEFLKLTQQRRSVRVFLDKPVPRELIHKACIAAAYAPSACNRQPFEFRIFDQVDLKNKVGALPSGIRAIHKDIPVFVVVVGRLSAYLSERDRHVIYIDGGLASMSFMLALETLGLSSVPINWPDIEYLEAQMERLIQLEDDERPMMLIGIGYADPEGGIPYSQKKSPDQLIIYNNGL